MRCFYLESHRAENKNVRNKLPTQKMSVRTLSWRRR